MAKRSFRRCIKLLTPKPSSRSSSVSPSKTCKMSKKPAANKATQVSLKTKANIILKIQSSCIMSVILSYLSTLDIFWAGADVHGHRHDNLQPGLHSARPPLGHRGGSGQFHLLEAVQLVLWPVWQAKAVASGAGEAVRVWVSEGGWEGTCGWRSWGCEWRQRW